MLGMLRSVWAYRGFVLGNVKREFQLKYRNPFWVQFGRYCSPWL